MNLAEHLLATAARSSPLVRETLRRHGGAPLGELLGSLRPATVRPLQPRDDLWVALGRHVAARSGAEAAADAVAELRADPILPTSNHFGVDTFADSVQGTLLFSLRPGARRTAVVLGFGSISLNNLTYPMGLRLYDPRRGDVAAVPQRLPVFPNRFKRCAVSAVGPFDEPMVRRARDRLRKMRHAGDVTAFCERTAGAALEEVFAAPETLSLQSYGHQSVRINAALWRRMFRDRAPTRLVQVEIEPVCAALLARDLYDPDSLLYRLLFEPRIRDAVLTGLDGERACWRLELLDKRLNDSTAGAGGAGTVFFWGLTEQGRRVPLALDAVRGALTGLDERGRRREWECTPDGIAAGLAGGTLLPSLFTCFSLLALARGVTCVGGYYQVGYLPVMQRAVVRALTRDHREAAETIAQVPTSVCLAGLQAIARTVCGGAVIPAGPVEIAGAGGLTAADLDRIPQITVRESHLTAFAETFGDLAPNADLPDDWLHSLTTENRTACPRVIRLEEE